ncbi:MAG TPA: CHAD domain-containing protein [Polyangiaceae bacterium]
MRALATELGATLPRVRDRSDPEAIHDMRVALRRLRVVLRIARPVFGRFHCDAIRGALARVQRASGALRDEEVLRETLTALDAGESELDAWIVRRARREESLRGIVEHRLRAGDVRRPLRELRALLALPVRPDRRRPVAAFAHKSAARARQEVDRKSDARPDDPAALHALRIACKRLRYTTEIFADALPPTVAALAEPATRYQKRLGEIHDLDVARLVIARTRSLSPAVKSRVLEAIARARDARIERWAHDRAAHPLPDPE